MTDDKWCPENDAAYRAELAAIHGGDATMRLRARIAALEAQVAAADLLADDLIAHRGPWMHAMTSAAHSEPDDGDYWRHERAAFMTTLAKATAYRAAKGE